MKAVLVVASAVMIFSGIAAANAQNAGPTYSNSIHQSAGDRDSRGTPKYYQSERSHYRHRMTSRYAPRGRYTRSTTGAGSSGPYYSNTIHQSSGRDSRGTPKTLNGQ